MWYHKSSPGRKSLCEEIVQTKILDLKEILFYLSAGMLKLVVDI